MVDLKLDKTLSPVYVALYKAPQMKTEEFFDMQKEYLLSIQMQTTKHEGT